MSTELVFTPPPPRSRWTDRRQVKGRRADDRPDDGGPTVQGAGMTLLLGFWGLFCLLAGLGLGRLIWA